MCDSKEADELAPPPLPPLLPRPTAVFSVSTLEIRSEWESVGAEEEGGGRMVVGTQPSPWLASGADIIVTTSAAVDDGGAFCALAS